MKSKEPWYSTTLSCREYYCYKLQIKFNVKSALLIAKQLLQQNVVLMYINIETTRLGYTKKKIPVANYIRAILRNC